MSHRVESANAPQISSQSIETYPSNSQRFGVALSLLIAVAALDYSYLLHLMDDETCTLLRIYICRSSKSRCNWALLASGAEPEPMSMKS
mmetsp:Transcript_6629/g.11759  ORF Transcript_6629/g.11759 Transcript_6629/m.11759 type:complete len:89 (-) Transcript_6629:389-655(-)